jgi:hypothetical protein
MQGGTNSTFKREVNRINTGKKRKQILARSKIDFRIKESRTTESKKKDSKFT